MLKKAPEALGVVTVISALLNLQEVDRAVAAVNGAPASAKPRHARSSYSPK